MSDDTYNGWTNYATWRVQLEIVSDYVNNQDERTFADMGLGDVATQIEEEVDQVLTGYGSGRDDDLALDYARSFVSDVNWYELAKHAMEDNDEAFPFEHEESEDEES